jgi:pre-rRNA-processing protein TSR3
MSETVIIRHPKERRSKCSLTPIEGVSGYTFLRWSRALEFDADGYTVLAVDAPPLSTADAGRPLLVLDGTWRLLKDLETCVLGAPVRRSIPSGVQTAYPRVSRYGTDPEGGLASIEALFVARALLGFWEPTLLDGYRWRDQFLASLPEEILALQWAAAE